MNFYNTNFTKWHLQLVLVVILALVTNQCAFGGGHYLPFGSDK